ncbi:MAG: Rpn family recombination-promoting nuclease/putative transposase [Deltaproteobacteria bacterium]|jgi:predicted transposase/invertase (TIGR01784 family)|nr:Rpn family recombination-promoting nuclease/putative transposase [Deltaproteobacteria bacterium]
MLGGKLPADDKGKRTYKDNLFVKLFTEGPKPLRNLLSAVYKKRLEGILELVTLENVVFTGLYNDIALMVGTYLLVLIEHQSTINDNMPLRLLMYVAEIFKRLFPKKVRYQSELHSLPCLDFLVFYNGADDYPEEVTLKLSDAFRQSKLELPESLPLGLLELNVKVYNINLGKNDELLKKSPELFGYSTLIAKIRHKREIENKVLADAIKEAMDECISEGILSEFLSFHSREVENMLTAEFNMDDALEVREEVGFNKGMKKGREEGREEGRKEVTTKYALRLLKKGETPKDVADILEVTLAEVEKLVKNNSSN